MKCTSDILYDKRLRYFTPEDTATHLIKPSPKLRDIGIETVFVTSCKNSIFVYTLDTG